MRLADMPWPLVREVIASGATGVVPMGSVEEHGPHVPMGDYIETDEIAARAAEITGDVVVPILPFGYSEYFRCFPGTITLRDSTLGAVLTDILDCLLTHKFRRVVIFNGHKGNSSVVELVTRRFRRKYGIVIPSISPSAVTQTPEVIARVYGGPVELGHGGEPGGSVMMYLRPGRVLMERAGAWGRKLVWGCPSEGLGTIRVGGLNVSVPLDMEDIAPSTGSLSDPTCATPERGQQLVGYSVEACVKFLQWFRGVDPYLHKSAAQDA